MGQDIYEAFGFVRELFEMASDIVKSDLPKLIFKGPMENLTQTVNLQPALTVVNLSFLAAIQNEQLKPDVTSGHSLGEYSALNASGVFTDEDTIRLVLKRGELMHRESIKYEGAMHAIIGLPIQKVQELVNEVQNNQKIVSVANHNTELQIVITGSPDPVNEVSSLAASQGAKTIPLNVSGAWHSDLIKGAEEEFKVFLDTVSFAKSEVPVIHNVTADIATTPDEIKAIMAKQLCNPVCWYSTMCKLIEANVETFAEIGPGRVLAGLLKKTLPKDYPAKIYNINTIKNLETFLQEITE
jgi:[acyl-carrier-protein] S-malonyltransferase